MSLVCANAMIAMASGFVASALLTIVLKFCSVGSNSCPAAP